MVEIRDATRLYAERHPYQVERIREPSRDDNRWRYKLTFDPPDPMIALMFGDFIHNLRSALDHVVVACSKPRYRRSAEFPVAHSNFWAKGTNGEFLYRHTSRREKFERAIEGLDDLAKTIIIEAQPYRRDRTTDIIGILSRLENADKHRNLIAIGADLRGGSITVHSRGVLQSTHSIASDQFFYDKAEVLSFTVANPSIRESEVKVHASGTATISLNVTGIEGKEILHFPLRPTVLKALDNVRFLLRVLERFAIRS